MAQQDKIARENVGSNKIGECEAFWLGLWMFAFAWLGRCSRGVLNADAIGRQFLGEEVYESRRECAGKGRKLVLSAGLGKIGKIIREAALDEVES